MRQTHRLLSGDLAKALFLSPHLSFVVSYNTTFSAFRFIPSRSHGFDNWCSCVIFTYAQSINPFINSVYVLYNSSAVSRLVSYLVYFRCEPHYIWLSFARVQLLCREQRWLCNTRGGSAALRALSPPPQLVMPSTRNAATRNTYDSMYAAVVNVDRRNAVRCHLVGEFHRLTG